jgi:hypothetical protein
MQADEPEDGVDAHDLQEAFERGREVGRREGMAFKGVPALSPWSTGVEFRFERSWFDSFVSYERSLVETLRQVQRARWIERAHWDGASNSRDSAFEMLQRRIADELALVRDAVDAERATGRGRACVVDALRAEPNRPVGVWELPDVEIFVREDQRRALPDWPERRDAGGADYGSHWRLEDPLRPWITSQWRVSWLNADDPTYEVYAIERMPAFREEAQTGRVWLLGVLRDYGPAHEMLSELQLHAQGERNSLVVVAEAVGSCTS